MGIIEWCDRNLTKLKENNIKIINGIPTIPNKMIYEGVPEYIETYQYRSEIPVNKRKKSLLAFYSFEDRLWSRLNRIDEDSQTIKEEYGGIVGMDISPSVLMLRPRQYHSMLINAIYNCLMALNGVKVAINARVGDLGTMRFINMVPKNKTLVFSNLGCRGKFMDYSLYQFKYWIENNKPKIVCLYGALSSKCINKLKKLHIRISIFLYHEHNYSTNKKKSVFIIRGNEYTTNNPRNGLICELILTHGIKKINPFDDDSLEGGDGLWGQNHCT